MKFFSDKITMKELADGTVRLYVDTGEYEYSKVLRQLAKLREDSQEDTAYVVEIKRKEMGSISSPSQKESATKEHEGSQENGGNDYEKLWGLITTLANLRDVEKDEMEKKLKDWLDVDSFTELSKTRRKKLERSIKSRVKEISEENAKELKDLLDSKE